MLKEIKYLIFFIVIVFFIFFSIKYYISDTNIKKTFKNLTSIDKNISIYESELSIISNDTEDVVKYLNNDEDSNKKKYSFWELLN